MKPVLNLVDPGDAVLNRVAQVVATEEIQAAMVQQAIDRMHEIARSRGHDGTDRRQMVGLAAPQIGLSKRIILIDLAADGSHKPQDLREFINPVISWRSAVLIPGREGCWSTGSICGKVLRAQEVVLEAVDRRGLPVSHTFRDFTARIAQHEADHLDGIRFPDRLEKDEQLHWVEPAEFATYRMEWPMWSKLCLRATWEAMKAGRPVQGGR